MLLRSTHVDPSDYLVIFVREMGIGKQCLEFSKTPTSRYNCLKNKFICKLKRVFSYPMEVHLRSTEFATSRLEYCSFMNTSIMQLFTVDIGSICARRWYATSFQRVNISNQTQSPRLGHQYTLRKWNRMHCCVPTSAQS